MRASNHEYADWLLSLLIGNGLLPNPIQVALDHTKFTDTLVASTFGNIINSTNIDSLKEVAILSPSSCTTNTNVHELNELVLSIVASKKI